MLLFDDPTICSLHCCISHLPFTQAFRRKAAYSPKDHEGAGDVEAARAVGGGMERRRSNQINKLSTEDLHGKSNQDIFDELKRKYDRNGDGIFQDEEVDQMLLDTIEICRTKEGLEVEKDMMLNKVRNPLLSCFRFDFTFLNLSYHSLSFTSYHCS